MKIEPIYTNKAPKPIGSYSQAVMARGIKGLLFVSGQIGINPKTGKLIGEDVREQTKQTLENLKAILKETKARAVKTTVLLADMADFQTVNEIYAFYVKDFGDILPARAAFQPAALPAKAKIEIEAIAVV